MILLENITESDAPVDRKTIEEFERRNKIRLPADYIEFLLAHNGGRPEPECFPILGLQFNPFGSIDSFYALNSAIRACDLQFVLSDIPDSVPVGIVPIASNGSGDHICLDLRRPGAPVVFFDYRPFWGNNEWREDLLYPVAPNFSALLNSLQDYPEDLLMAAAEPKK